jgi:septum formation protein
VDIQERFREYNIILASKSPRRRKLLKEIGLKFDVIEEVQIKEEYPPDLSCEEIPVYLAKHKAHSCIEYIGPLTILIAADTIVCLDNEVLDKPGNYNDAFNTLKKLSGRKHTVITGICLKSVHKEAAFRSVSDVYFRNLTDAEIDHYIRTYKPFDKAGSYGIQEWIGYIGIERIEGSYFNVMGLPTHELYTGLCNFIETGI